MSEPQEAAPPSSTAQALLLTPASDLAIDDLIQKGDFSALTMRERSIFCFQLAKRLGLDPLTKPFLFIVLNNIVTLYATKACSDQLRKNKGLSDDILYEGPLMIGDELRKDVYMVKVCIQSPEGRHEDAIGCIGIDNLKGEQLANAVMKCHTKALRRGTLSFCGLGMPDELEVESVKGLEGGEGNPRQIQPPALYAQESFPTIDAKPLPLVPTQPTKTTAAKPLPRVLPDGSSQPAAPKLPAVLPAVKP